MIDFWNSLNFCVLLFFVQVVVTSYKCESHCCRVSTHLVEWEWQWYGQGTDGKSWHLTRNNGTNTWEYVSVQFPRTYKVMFTLNKNHGRSFEATDCNDSIVRIS